MAKKITAQIRLQVPGGQATPAPPVGPALGQHGVNIGEFVQKFNAQTAEYQGMGLPVTITVFKDRTFKFAVGKPLAAVLIKKSAGIVKGAGAPSTETVATISESELEKIAKTKMEDLNAADLEGAKRIIAGTAKSMGIKIKD
jgi:large subunit ribosomal protein L11